MVPRTIDDPDVYRGWPAMSTGGLGFISNLVSRRVDFGAGVRLIDSPVSAEAAR